MSALSSAAFVAALLAPPAATENPPSPAPDRVGKASCSDAPVDPLALIPDDAKTIVGVDVDELTKSPLWRVIEPGLHADRLTHEATRVLEACGVELEKIYALTLARGPQGSLAVATGNALGTPETLNCVAQKLRARNEGKAMWKSSTRGCAQALELEQGHGLVVIPTPYTIVWTRGAWSDEVAARSVGQGGQRDPSTRALQGALEQTKRDKHIWLSSTVDEHDREVLPSRWLNQALTLSLSLDLSQGFVLELALLTAGLDSAAYTRDALLENLSTFTQKLSARGVGLQLTQGSWVAADQQYVRAALGMSQAALLQLRRQLGPTLDGAGLW